MHSTTWCTAVATAVSLLAAGAAMGQQQKQNAEASVSKNGIPYVPDDKLGPPDLIAAIKSRRPHGKLLNLDRMLLHSPNFTQGWNTMFAAIRNKLSLPGKLREIAIMSIAVYNKADYEWIQHEPEFLKAGGTQQQLQALKSNIDAAEKDGKLFDETERATLTLTREMTKNVAVSDATIQRIRGLLKNDQYLIELIGTIAGYNMVSRFLLATGVEMEQTGND
jgi:alkylhydroperoxidase family enzyme